jgi:hypothetical protein
MSQSTQTTQEAIIEALKRVGADSPCPRCGNTSFALLGEYDFILSKQGGIVDLPIGNRRSQGRMVPAVLVGCEQCGYLSTHGLGALGLLPPDEDSR